MSWQNLPEELRAIPQWVGAREDKKPVDPKTGKAASVTDPATWGTFEEACSCGTAHVGFVFTQDDPYVFIDLDTKKDPALTKLHAEIVRHADSYTETSKSGEGSHIIVRGTIENGLRADQQGIEIYPHGRYMLATGWHYYGHSVADGQEILNYLAEMIQKDRFVAGELTSSPSNYTDEILYNTILGAENGEKFLALWNNEWQDYKEYMGDHSRADLALATFLDFYSKDVDQVVRMFKYSKLYRPSKGRQGGDGTDYILRTVKQARARNEADIPPQVDLSELVARAKEVTRNSRQAAEKGEVTTAPSPVTFPVGLVGEVAQYIYTSAIRPVPEVALMGALAMISGIVGRQYNVSGTGLNQYYMLLAPTGSGKEGASSGISNLITRVRQTVPSIDQFVGPAEFASGPALIRTLDSQPCMFSIIGEFGFRLQTMADPRSNGAEKTLQRALLNIYSKSGWHQTESGSAYSDKEKNTQTLYAPALTILGESTPESFFQGLSEHQVKSGLLPRFLFLEYTGPRPPRNRVSAFCDPAPELVTKVADLAAAVLQMQANAACSNVVIDAPAQATLDEFDTFCDQKINGGTEVHKHLWNRAHLKALRLSGLLAVGVNAMNPVITAELANWSIRLVIHDLSLIEGKFIRNEIGEGEHLFEKAVRRAVADYLEMDESVKASYRVPKRLLMHPVIPYAYLRRRLRCLAEFRNDRRGVTMAIQCAIKDCCEADILQLVPSLTRKTTYGVTAEIYVIGECW